MKRKPRLRSKRITTESVLRLADLKHGQGRSLEQVTSSDAQRGYRHAIDEFVEWYCSEPRRVFNRIVGVTLSISLRISSTGTGHNQPTPRRRAATRLPPCAAHARLRTAATGNSGPYHGSSVHTLR